MSYPTIISYTFEQGLAIDCKFFFINFKGNLSTGHSLFGYITKERRYNLTIILYQPLTRNTLLNTFPVPLTNKNKNFNLPIPACALFSMIKLCKLPLTG